MVTPHHVDWVAQRGSMTLEPRIVCTAPEGADCRLQCPEGCEEWTIERDTDGPFHRAQVGDGEDVIHRMESTSDYCNVEVFLSEADTFVELYNGPRQVIASTPLEPVWEGDYYGWKAAR